MVSDHDQWMFLLTVATLPLACADNMPADMDPYSGPMLGTTSGDTSPDDMPNEPDAEGESTSAAGDDASDDDSGATTVSGTSDNDPDDGGSSGNEGDAAAICEAYGVASDICYGHGDGELTSLFADWCLDYLESSFPGCQAEAQAAAPTWATISRASRLMVMTWRVWNIGVRSAPISPGNSYHWIPATPAEGHMRSCSPVYPASAVAS